MKTKNLTFLLSLWLSMGMLMAQGEQPIPMNIAANEYTTVSFFFPSGIAKVVPPAVNYKFDYEPGSNLGFLKARKGNPSNLTVITASGHIFSFRLLYDEKVQTFNYVLKEGNAIGKTNVAQQQVKSESGQSATSANSNALATAQSQGNGQNTPNDTLTATTSAKDTTLVVGSNEVNGAKPNGNGAGQNSNKNDDLYDEDRDEYYRVFCENNYLQRTVFKRSFRENVKIKVKLNNILLDRNEIYFVMQVENNSEREFRVNGLSFFLKRPNEEDQQIMFPVFTYNLQEVIDPDSVNEVVYVFEKFRLKPREQLFIVLDEAEGSRMVFLPLTNKQVNAPAN